jgi:hypothetical protein
MKTTFHLLAVLTAVGTAQEANPFLNQAPQEKPSAESGEAFTELAEHIVVPADVLDEWLVAHPQKSDASELRRVVQTWVEEGKAKLDYTAVITGTVGQNCTNESVNEQIYATEYVQTEADEWTLPTSFECRNLGYTLEGGASHGEGGLSFRADMDFVRMLPHRAWSVIAEKTRQPTDVFIPRYRSIRVNQSVGATVRPEQDPFAPAPAPDPFGGGPPPSDDIVWTDPDAPVVEGSSPAKPPVPVSPPARFAPGKTYLAARADEELPMPVDPADPSPAAVKVQDPPANRPVRLIFFRGAVAAKTAPVATQLPDDYSLAAKLVTVDQKTLSDWIQKQELATLVESAWPAAEEWRKAGTASVLREVSGTSFPGAKGLVEDIVEVTYPTEWEPGKRIPAQDNQPARREPCLPTSYETRNSGLTLETALFDKPKGSLLRVSLEHVVHGGNSVHHRVLRDGAWMPDITFPRMTCLRWQTELRVKPGAWMFVGTGAALKADGQFDPARAVMAFIKVE